MQVEAQRREYLTVHPRAEELIVVTGERPAGRLWLARDADPWVLLDVALLPEERGAGLGTAVLSALTAEADAAGAAIRLTVRRDNAGARRLYERLGFAVRDEDELHLVMLRPPRGGAPRPATG